MICKYVIAAVLPNAPELRTETGGHLENEAGNMVPGGGIATALSALF